MQYERKIAKRLENLSLEIVRQIKNRPVDDLRLESSGLDKVYDHLRDLEEMGI